MPLVLYFLLGSAGTLLIAGRGIVRFRTEPARRWLVALATGLSLALWLGCSWVLGLINFGVAMGMAHTPVRRPGPFPEGWPVYAATAAYALIGLGLFLAVGKLPPKQAAA
jgi:hypothetical protein